METFCAVHGPNVQNCDPYCASQVNAIAEPVEPEPEPEPEPDEESDPDLDADIAKLRVRVESAQ